MLKKFRFISVKQEELRNGVEIKNVDYPYYCSALYLIEHYNLVKSGTALYCTVKSMGSATLLFTDILTSR